VEAIPIKVMRKARKARKVRKVRKARESVRLDLALVNNVI
tara:strand:+ start:404 stop:523 length:120 start_codon:yes stop_codon:yes gene_type:complete